MNPFGPYRYPEQPLWPLLAYAGAVAALIIIGTLLIGG